ncbi:MAG: ACP S-malonyltransferase [Gemmatimonadota bacterium]
MKRLAVMMPGQGSQYVGMGLDLAMADARAMELFERADRVLGVPLSRICWEGPVEELTRTENAQPAILLHSIIAWTLLPDEVRSAATVGAGHSLGEFTAYVAAGSLELDDALRLVRRRGELMAESGDVRAGTMAAVIGLDPGSVEAVCEEISAPGCEVVPANFNAPGQIVISGDVSAVESAMVAVLEAGARKVVPLNVSGAFHSPLMETARSGLAAKIDGVNLADPRFPIVANASADEVRTAHAARARLVEQLTAPVRWVESIQTIAATAPDLWIEVGPGRVLSGLLKRIVPGQSSAAAGSPEELEQMVEAFNA